MGIEIQYDNLWRCELLFFIEYEEDEELIYWLDPQGILCDCN
jgi:hypothetical protein